MKRIVLISALPFLCFQLFAQENNPDLPAGGTVRYTETVKLNIKVEGMPADMVAAMPKERKSEKVLVFNQTHSLFSNDMRVAANENVMSGGGMTIAFRGADPENQLYYNLQDQKKIERREFMTRVFLIEDQVNTASWKLTGNEKSILNYPCQEATREVNERTERVWFTPAIPISTGPGEFLGLPGLVLEADINNGERILTVTSVELGDIDKTLLTRPRKGTRVTQEEFDEIVREKMEEMGAQQGSAGGTFIIRTER